MSSNICGNCANFKPKQGDKFFNCTYAKQAGVSYAMQVRADTRSCQAFAPVTQSPKPQTAKPAPPAKRTEPQSGRLCPWGRIMLIAAIVIIVLLIGYAAYRCSSGGTPTTTPAPTPTPSPLPTSTGVHLTPTPTPTPIPIKYYDFGDLVTSPPWQISISTPQRVTTFNAPGPQTAAPGSVFLLVPVTVWNVGDTSLYVSAQSFQLVSAAGAIYGAKPPPISINFQSPFSYYTTGVGPQGSVYGIIIFNPPAIATDLTIRIFVNDQYLEWNVPQ